MKLYSFIAGNYLKEIQCGNQTTHALTEMIAKYPIETPEGVNMMTWAMDHKSVVMLNAFNSYGVKSAMCRLDLSANSLLIPVALFKEDDQSLDGATTSCAAIIPSFLCEQAKLDRIYKTGIDIPREWLSHWDVDPELVQAPKVLRDSLGYHEENIIHLINSYKTV